MNLRNFFILLVVALAAIITISRKPVDANPREQAYNRPGQYPLLDPEQAPSEIRAQVMRGFHIMEETRKNVPEFAGDKIDCTNCHFYGGNSFGGRSNGFALVGVDHKYPRLLDSGKEYTLAERMNSCFIKSMNGKKLPLDHPDMQALVAYMKWISSGIPKGVEMPWLGEKKLVSDHIPSYENGQKLFVAKCAPCHGESGQGQERDYDLSYPPLWGDNAFNDAAGMNNPDTFAFFIYENMPYNEPKLSVEEAMDIAAYVTKQPRPKFHPPKE